MIFVIICIWFHLKFSDPKMGHLLPMYIAVVVTLLPLTEAAKILVIPIPVKSVFRLGLNAGQAVAESGHEVWIMGAARYKEDATERGLNYLEYDTSHADTFEEKAALRTAAAIADPDSQTKPSMLSFIGIVANMNFQMCNQTFSNRILMNTIRDHHFDLAIMGTTHVMNCMYLIPYKFDIPYVTYEVFEEPWIAGVIALPSHHPLLMADPPFSDHMAFSERLRNTMIYILFPLFIRQMNSDVYTSWFVPEKPLINFQTLRSQSKIFFVVIDNTCLDYPRQSAPNYRYIGAITTRPAGPLTGELKTFVDGANEGLILITFGSTKVGGECLRHLLPMVKKTVPRLRQRILIQLSIDEDPGKFPPNVRFERWIPQNDLLGHPNTVALVSHGGANGQMEATYHGVPQICVPITEEQKYNCHRMEEHHYGLVLSLREFSANDFLQALVTITTDHSYKQDVSRCSRIMHNLPQGKDQLAFWVNHILEFGGDHLRPSSADMPFHSLYMIDVLVCVFLLLTLVVGLLLIFLKCVYSYTRNMTFKKVKAEWFATP